MSGYPPVAGPDPSNDPLLAQLLAELHERHHGAVCCTLLYGSCLRSGDIYNGLIDLYLICDSYRAAYQRHLPSVANWLLPPNVFYAQTEAQGKILRAKVTIISIHDFRRGCSRAWFESYIWGRFSQPIRILSCRDTQTQQQIERALLKAVRTLLRNAVPALAEQGTVAELWQDAMALSYATELRSEGNGRASELIGASEEFYAAVTRQQADSLGFPFAVYDDAGQLCYRSRPGRWRRYRSRLAWAVRRVQGKLLSVARVVKALFTFEGGLDYIAWKLHRHSGQEIVIPDRVRRAPLIFLWGFFWNLYRRGIFK